ncbi:Acyl-CoA carboxylase epsilon subunit [Thermomonospora echinospora]|uniref:Acyl-CoA carboxylase epsilon subunit n=1 Tax=Thermomonospora echinospora TaxID=1992 RepID=A0A1H6E1A3_9ACTN|nr:acyl-CoA carboxylase subunit epsilon [Thermomonospora echinospora]SEG90776.1 Acyl-CoA carboxylase epsilon subunit [Thermomonospora echinospora]
MSAEGRPFLQVVRGDATPEEIAALVAVLSARAAAASAAAGGGTRRTSAWADRSRMVRTPLPHGPGAWRHSALPR